MNNKEALLFFPLKENDDIEELYEDLLFEYKQFFITKFPLKKVFEAKEKKMIQMQTAYSFLGGKHSEDLEERNDKSYHFPTEIKECFINYQQERNILKNNILRATSAFEICEQIKLLINLQNSYSEKWTVVSNLPDIDIQISIEPDPMSLLKAINEFNLNGGTTFEELNSKGNIAPDLLLKEAKRLYLSTKY
jgi:hypothetical protein